MTMNISPQLKQTAVKNFEKEFGEIVRQFAEDDSDYEYFVDEFLNGVQFGLTHYDARLSHLIEESACRYGCYHEHDNSLARTKLFECSSYVFMYGAEWGTNRANNIKLRTR